MGFPTSERTVRIPLVGQRSILPILVVDTGSSDDETLDGKAGVGLLRNHNATSEQEPVEWHGLRVVFVLRPVTGQVRPVVIRSTETRPSNKANVAVLANRSVGPENWVMEVLIRVMPTSTAAGPLKKLGRSGLAAAMRQPNECPRRNQA